MVCGYHSEERAQLSDKICTGLQLANFWQDFVGDRARGRRYIPADAMQRFHVTDEQLIARHFDANVRAMMQFLVADARARLTRGSASPPSSPPTSPPPSNSSSTAATPSSTPSPRRITTPCGPAPSSPKPPSSASSAALSLGKLSASLKPSAQGHTRMSAAQPVAQSPELTAAYAACRAIAKREAKNFYYSFRVLPQHKSDAMCAVYAFMRKADDLADDESLSLDTRRQAMSAWTAAWRASRTTPTTDPIFLALNDTQEDGVGGGIGAGGSPGVEPGGHCFATGVTELDSSSARSSALRMKA